MARRKNNANLLIALGWLVCASLVFGLAKSSIVACVLVGIASILLGAFAFSGRAATDAKTRKSIVFVVSAGILGWLMGLQQLSSIHELAAAPESAPVFELCERLGADVPTAKKVACASAFADKSVGEARALQLPAAREFLRRASELAPGAPGISSAQAAERAATLATEAKEMESASPGKRTERIRRLREAEQRLVLARTLDPASPAIAPLMDSVTSGLQRNQRAPAKPTLPMEPERAVAKDLPHPPALTDGLLVAVLEFRSQEQSHADRARFLTDRTRAAVIAAQPGLRMMTRENLLVLLPNEADLASCEGECEIDTGRRIGADAVISGELFRFDGRYKLSMKLHETKSGRLLASAVASGQDMEQLEQSLPRAARDLIGL